MNVNEIRILFDEPVIINTQDLTVTGITETYTPIQFSGVVEEAPGSFAATWTFPQVFPAERLNLTLSQNVTDQAGNQLDGEWQSGSDTFPSGDGNPGGNFDFAFNLLPADGDGNGSVDVVDTLLSRLRVGTSACNANYDLRFDVDASGVIDVLDVLLIRLRAGAGLPSILQRRTTESPTPTSLGASIDASSIDAFFIESVNTNSSNQDPIARPEPERIILPVNDHVTGLSNGTLTSDSRDDRIHGRHRAIAWELNRILESIVPVMFSNIDTRSFDSKP